MTGDLPLVTIAIPTYNRASTFLGTALRSACNQGYEPLEVLVSDNASPDATRELVASFADPRIRYHRHPENVGAKRNLEYCIQNSRGHYTLLLMDDDAVDATFVETCVRAGRQNPEAGLIRTGARVVDEDGEVIYTARNEVPGPSFTDLVIAWTESKTAPFLCSTLFRTQPLQRHGMQSRNHLWADVIAELTLAARYGRVDVPDVLATFCMHSGELTVRCGIEEWCDDSRELLDAVCAFAPDDAGLLRARLLPFLSSFNYWNALRLDRPWPARIAACRTVHREFGYLPKPRQVMKEILRQTGWLRAASQLKRAGERVVRRDA